MSKHLIIVESPAKVRTIKKFLGSGYEVEASVGHVRDLPTRTLGVDESKDFLPQYEVIGGKEKVVGKLKSLAAKADTVYLAPDPDREGEAIAYHVAELLKDKNQNIKRIQFNEITARAVKDALAHPREINTKLFESQQARRILDRLVGYKISPLLWSKVKRGISAGRVQSVALRLVVDREKERRSFVPEEYWVFKAMLASQNADKAAVFAAELTKIRGKKAKVGNAEAAQALEAEILANPFRVADVTEKERSRTPPPPFITSTLQQAANQRLGYGAKKTMSTAQRLYEGVDLGEQGSQALITYMRTDSVRISDEARAAARGFIESFFGQDYYPPQPRFFKTKGGAQDAHEAIRPVDVTIRPETLKGQIPSDQFHLYKLIWERFVASQMAAARFWDTTVKVEAGPTEWKAKGERLLFPGFLAASHDADKDQNLPPLAAGDELRLDKLLKEQKFTQPPPRFTEASLVKELEERRIGRPSTYAAIISTLLDRDYCTLEQKQFAPTDLGQTVSDLLAEHFTELMDVDFTAGMEDSLDKVADGDANWVDLLRQFTNGFYGVLKDAEKQMRSVKGGLETSLVCPTCGKPLVVKFGKAGQFLACTGYPDCSFTGNFTRDEHGEIHLVEAQPEQREVVGTCPQCSADLVVKKSRTGSRFIACTNYPACKYTAPFSTGVACPREGCTGHIVEKSSKRGKVFYSCSEYPKCDFALWDWPVAEACPECDSKVLVRKTTKAAGERIACPTKSCRYSRAVEND